MYIRVIGGRGEIAPVPGKANVGSALLVRLKTFQNGAGPRIEQVHRAVGLVANARERPAVAAETDGGNNAVMLRAQDSQGAIIQFPVEQVKPPTAHERGSVG